MANISSLEVEASKATLENLSSETIQNENMNMIFIFLDNIHYVAGDSVTGEVLVSLPHNSTESKIIINSIGVEEVYIYASDNLDAPFVEDTSDVYRFESVIKDWHKGTSAGQYVFPFSFKLPSYCPATFYYTGEDNLGNHLKAEISYSVSVKLQNDRNPEENQTHSRMFVVRNRYTRGKPCEKIETNEQVSGCCWRRKGSTFFRLSMKSEEHFQVGSQLKFKLDPDNTNCNTPINHVTGQIFLLIELTVKDKIYKVHKLLTSISRATWISAHTNLVYEKDFEYLAELNMNNEELNPSSNVTPLIKSSYIVLVLVYYDLACKSNPIEISMPFHVNPKNTFIREEPPLPRSWTPDEAPIMNFIIDYTRATSSEIDGMVNEL